MNDAVVLDSYRGPRGLAAVECLLEGIWTLRDGTRVRLGLLGPGDRADLLVGFADLSKRSRYLRFFSAMDELPENILERLLSTDAYRHVAICARLLETNERVQSRIVGVAHYFRVDGEADTAEVAMAVIDGLQGHGLGRMLLHTIAAYARANGIAKFRAYTLADNAYMRHLLLTSGGVLAEQDGPVEVYDIDIGTEVAVGRQAVGASVADEI